MTNSDTLLTFESTINKIVTEMRIVEKELKACFKPLLSSYLIAPLQPGLHFPKIYEALESIAPPNLSNLEPDYHYVWRLYLMGPNPHMFKDDISMQKQWESYRFEIETLFCFIQAVTKPTQELDFTPLMSSPDIQHNIINHPFARFESTPCKKNTFSKIINCTGHLIPILYIYTIARVLKQSNTKI